MKDEAKTTEQLIKELKESQVKISKFEESELKLKKIEDALRESEEKYRKIFEEFQDLYYKTDLKGIIWDISPSVTRIAGYEREELIGKPVFEVYKNPPDHINFLKALKKKGYIEDYEITLLGKSGREIIASASSHILYDKNNKPIGIEGVLRDITERKHAEEEMQKLAAVVKYSSELVNLSTLDGRMIFLNEAGGKMLGIEPHEIENVNIMEVIPDHLVELVEKELLPALMKGRTWEGDLQYRNMRTGELTNVHAMTFTVKDTDTGEPQFLANVSLDITERKQAENELRESAAYLEIMGDALMVIDSHANVVKVNKVFSDLWGYTQNEVYGKPAFGMFPKEELSKHQSELEKVAKKGGTRIFETIALTKDKKEINVSVSGTVLKDEKGKTLNFIALFRDISERKHAEEALQQSKDELNVVFNCANDGLVLCDKTGKILRVNKYIVEIGGYAEEEFVGKRLNALKMLPLKSISKMTTIFSKLIKGQEISFEAEVTTKKGEMKVVEIHNSFLKKEGKVERVVAVLRDITERKLAENKIKKSLKEKEILLQEIHHRVKNNMQVILSLIMLQYDVCQEEKIKELFQKTYSRVKAMCLVHEKLYKSDDYSNINIRGYIEHLVLELFDSYGVDPSRIQLELLVEIVDMNIKESLPLGLIINELVSNSLKYAFPAKVKRKGKIHISLQPKNNNEFQLLIGDDGVGIPEHIDPFKSNTLGLRMVNILVKNQLDGHFKLNRRKGTLYTICFTTEK